MKRISDEIFKETKSLEDLVQLMAFSKDGHSYAEIGEPKQFLARYKMFKEMIGKNLPNFTFEEILKFDEYFHEIKESVYGWYGSDRYLTCLEYEERKKNIPPQKFGIICKDNDDFLNFKSERYPEHVSKDRYKFKYNNDLYYDIHCILQTVGQKLDGFIETEKAKENEEYNEIFDHVRLSLINTNQIL